MKRMTFYIVLFSLTIHIGCTRADPETKQESAILDPIVGVWDLSNFTITDNDGVTSYPYGENASGRIVYSSSGHLSVQLMRPDPDLSRFAGLEGVQILLDMGLTTFFAYWGTFQVDHIAGTVTHFIDGCLLPTWVGTAKARHYRFENENRLILSAQVAERDDPTALNELIWVRVQ